MFSVLQDRPILSLHLITRIRFSTFLTKKTPFFLEIPLKEFVAVFWRTWIVLLSPLLLAPLLFLASDPKVLYCPAVPLATCPSTLPGHRSKGTLLSCCPPRYLPLYSPGLRSKGTLLSYCPLATCPSTLPGLRSKGTLLSYCPLATCPSTLSGLRSKGTLLSCCPPCYVSLYSSWPQIQRYSIGLLSPLLLAPILCL